MTHDKELTGVPATGRWVSVQGVIHSDVRDGRIFEEWELPDEAKLVRQWEGVSE